jgi:hypothetical protein
MISKISMVWALLAQSSSGVATSIPASQRLRDNLTNGHLKAMVNSFRPELFGHCDFVCLPRAA